MGNTIEAMKIIIDTLGDIAKVFSFSALHFIRDMRFFCIFEKKIQILLPLTFPSPLSSFVDLFQAVEFAVEYDDEALWEELIDQTVRKAEHVGDLLDHIGAAGASQYVNPVLLVQRVPPDMDIPNLRDRLRRIVADYSLQCELQQGVYNVLRDDCVGLIRRYSSLLSRGHFGSYFPFHSFYFYINLFHTILLRMILTSAFYDDAVVSLDTWYRFRIERPQAGKQNSRDLSRTSMSHHSSRVRSNMFIRRNESFIRSSEKVPSPAGVGSSPTYFLRLLNRWREPRGVSALHILSFATSSHASSLSSYASMSGLSSFHFQQRMSISASSHALMDSPSGAFHHSSTPPSHADTGDDALAVFFCSPQYDVVSARDLENILL